MATSDIRELSGAELDAIELSQVRDIVEDKSPAEIKVLCDALVLLGAGNTPLPESQQGLLKLTRNDLGFFYDRSPEGTVKVKGGKEGDDFDVERDREDTRQRLRIRLGLPAVSELRRAFYARSSRIPVSQYVTTRRVMRS